MSTSDRRITVGNPPAGSKEPAGKNPYEIRLDVLKLAQEMAQLKYKADETAFDLVSTTDLPFNQLSTAQASQILAAAPKAMSATEIISEATMLYEFVSNNSRNVTKK